MSDDEVRQLAGRLNALPAGGAMSTEEWLLVIVVILLVIIILWSREFPGREPGDVASVKRRQRCSRKSTA